MHNAIVMGTDNEPEHVRVVFCNPTQQSMKICDHFMNDKCSFGDKCKYSHGHKVHADDLHEYLELNLE